MKGKTLIIIFLFFVFVLSACNFPDAASADNGSFENRILTVAAQTVEAILTESPIQVVEETPMPTLLISTQTVGDTPAPNSQTATADSVEATANSETTCNLATFIRDVTVEDGDDFSPGETFTKTWRLKNTGSCIWTVGFDIIFYDGDSMGGPASRQLTNSEIAPGEELSISVELTAPLQKGTYKGLWKLRSSNGIVFSLKNNAAFWVEINVVP